MISELSINESIPVSRTCNFMIINYVTQFDNAVFIYLFVSLFEFPKCY